MTFCHSTAGLAAEVYIIRNFSQSNITLSTGLMPRPYSDMLALIPTPFVVLVIVMNPAGWSRDHIHPDNRTHHFLRANQGIEPSGVPGLYSWQLLQAKRNRM